uniref:Uncharacterized protein n=1 Tax=Grammatophora oceanica TaxID=210454 RepID=A0A7S1VDM4_9STRA|mmetsp:Transcript_43637/g.64772  ORF Transcript_43637/g.64772 Transcript_43637/m.64772 type:complete len:117 (+) Transcript_43637:124-474(+)
MPGGDCGASIACAAVPCMCLVGACLLLVLCPIIFTADEGQAQGNRKQKMAPTTDSELLEQFIIEDEHEWTPEKEVHELKLDNDDDDATEADSDDDDEGVEIHLTREGSISMTTSMQ